MAASHDPAQLSPKVKQPAIAGVILVAALVVVAAFLGGIGEEQLAGLGVWAGPIGAAITALVLVLRGYQATDPLRQDTAHRIETLELALAEKDRELTQETYPAQAEDDLRRENLDTYQGKHEAEPATYNPPDNLKG